MKYPFQRPRLTKAEIDGFEPFERNRQIPLVVLWVAVALAIWGGVTLLGVRTPVTNGQLQSNGQVLAATPPHVASGPDIFSARCATCHQANAVGVKGAVPPLVGSTFASGDPSIIIQILLHGIDGPIEVSGATYNGHMPSFASVMSDEEIATITNYIQNSWGTNSHSIDRSAVATQRVRFGERKAWQGGFEIATILNPQTSSKLPDLKAIAADPKPHRHGSEPTCECWSRCSLVVCFLSRLFGSGKRDNSKIGWLEFRLHCQAT